MIAPLNWLDLMIEFKVSLGFLVLGDSAFQRLLYETTYILLSLFRYFFRCRF